VKQKAATWEELPLVEVVWEDAAIDTEHSGDLDTPGTAATFGGMVTCRDVGYLVRKDRKVIVLAVGVVQDSQSYRHSNTIPRGWVKEIIPLSRLVSASSSQPSAAEPSKQ
jgi:hypothetical protein